MDIHLSALVTHSQQFNTLRAGSPHLPVPYFLKSNQPESDPNLKHNWQSLHRVFPLST